MAGPENLGDPIQVDVNNIYAEVVEIETHLHSYERWRGAHGSPTATRFADQTETAFQIDSGNAVFGSWVQILGSDDTPIDSGKMYYDLHLVLVVANEQATTYRIQFAFGETGDAAVAAGEYTEVLVRFPVGVARPSPFTVQGERHAAGTLCWARCRTSTNTGTIDFLIGMHEYDS